MSPRNANTTGPANTTTPRSFRRQLFGLLSVGLVLLSLLASSIFAWLSSNEIENLYVQEGLQATENFASDAELALLYDSGENGKDAADAVLAFPSISQAFIINLKNKVLLQQGTDEAQPIINVNAIVNSPNAHVVHENRKRWLYAAPVYSTQDDSSTIPEEDTVVSPTTSELLGYVLVAQDKAQLRNIQVSTFSKHLLVGLLYGVVSIVILHIALKKLLRPMDALSSAMLQTRTGDIQKIDNLHGPREIHQMIMVYNSMLDAITDRDQQLRQHNDQLESLIAQRTQELVLARDEALNASKQKSMFLANVSHELRTPLQSIIGYSDVIKESLEDEGFDELAPDIERINYNANHLLTLINSLLDLAKIESGKATLNLADADINDIIRQAESAAGPIIAKNNNHFTVETKGLNQHVRIDSQKLLQIIINLLSNAGKFTSHGHVTLSAELTSNLLRICVKDTGIGIEQDAQNTLFIPFRQVDGSFTRKFEGTGLGLSICKYFCSLMGGNITLTSALGEGATFTVDIPLPIVNTEPKETL